MTDPGEEQRTRIAYRAALIAALLNAAGWPIELMIELQLRNRVIWPAVSATCASLLLATVLLIRRGRIGTAASSFAFLVNSIIVAIALWFSNEQYAEQVQTWVPFQATKLGVLTVALLAPELWVGLLSIWGYALAAVAQWYGFDAAVRARAVLGEPWAMIAYATFAAALLVQARHRMHVERELLRSHHDAVALTHLARTLLAIRDYSNTPLQTLILSIDLLLQRHPELGDELAVTRRAFARLQELNRLLSVHEARLPWSPGDESFDPGHVLAQLGRPYERRTGPTRSP